MIIVIMIVIIINDSSEGQRCHGAMATAACFHTTNAHTPAAPRPCHSPYGPFVYSDPACLRVRLDQEFISEVVVLRYIGPEGSWYLRC